MRREYPNQPIVGVSAVVVEQGKILLVKRGVKPALSKWTIPGGAVELGEKVRDAVKREIKEECSIEIELLDNKPMDITDILIQGENNKYRYHYVVIQFLARKKYGILKPSQDVTEARWVELKEVEKYDLTKLFRLFFKKHRHKLEKN